MTVIGLADMDLGERCFCYLRLALGMSQSSSVETGAWPCGHAFVELLFLAKGLKISVRRYFAT